MPEEIGEFLEKLPIAPPPKENYPGANLEVLIKNARAGRINYFEMEDLIKVHGFKPELFDELHGGWFKLRMPEVPKNGQ